MSDISSIEAVCPDCAYMAGDGDPSELDPNILPPLSALVGHGIIPACEPVTDNDGNWEASFSWHGCPGCASPLGGDRYDIRVYWNTTEE